MKRFDSRLVLGPVLVLTVAALVLGVVLATRGGSSHRARAAEVTLPTWAHDYVLKQSQEMGEPNPSGQWALTTSDAVARAFGQSPAMFAGSLASATDSVYLFVLHGQFVDQMAFLPGGAAAPKGTIVVFAVDSVTHECAGFGISDKTPDTSAVGPMNDFTP